MCNKISSRQPWTVCSVCKEYIDSVGRCGCDYKRTPSRVNRNSGKLVAAFAGIVLAASLLVSPAKAQSGRPTPTATVGGYPVIAVEHKVFMPYIATSETVLGCDDCQAVSWRPTGDMKW